jgi:hypothetical protein
MPSQSNGRVKSSLGRVLPGAHERVKAGEMCVIGLISLAQLGMVFQGIGII